MKIPLTSFRIIRNPWKSFKFLQIPSNSLKIPSTSSKIPAKSLKLPKFLEFPYNSFQIPVNVL